MSVAEPGKPLNSKERGREVPLASVLQADIPPGWKLTGIGRLIVLLVVFVIGITSPAFPAAATDQPKPILVSLVSPSGKPASLNPTFDKQKVSLGITPTGWSNGDDPSIDLNPPIRYQQILSEMALAGFQGSQMSGKFPQEISELQSELGLRNLTISEPWVGTKFTEGKEDETVKEFEKQMDFMKKIGGTKIVVAELGGAVHQDKSKNPLTDRPMFTEDEWQKMTQGLNKLGSMAKANGMQLCYHPHVGTGVQSLEEIDKLMAYTDPDKVKLLLDTGHLYYAEVDPLEVTKKYTDRIKHVHLKNIRESVLAKSKQNGLSFLGSIQAGVFTVPGDTGGAIDFAPILQELAQANYQGWLVVEAEQDPNKTNPLKNAVIARTYLRELTGL
ncbi:myo-inosose-2 dehydratase [Microcystis aeruginosa]|nr:myo-inosose-2 dehydratase [Microcystis aeruginosa]